jgi:hypothetical protein
MWLIFREVYAGNKVTIKRIGDIYYKERSIHGFFKKKRTFYSPKFRLYDKFKERIKRGKNSKSNDWPGGV